MSVAETIRQKLTERLAPTRLEIIDESHRHAGHAGARPEGETHFAVTVTSNAFTALGRVARQQETNINQLVTEIHRRRNSSSLTAAIRVYIVDFYRSAATQAQRGADLRPALRS